MRYLWLFGSDCSYIISSGISEVIVDIQWLLMMFPYPPLTNTHNSPQEKNYIVSAIAIRYIHRNKAHTLHSMEVCVRTNILAHNLLKTLLLRVFNFYF